MNDNADNLGKKTGPAAQKLAYYFIYLIVISGFFIVWVFTNYDSKEMEPDSEVANISEPAPDGKYLMARADGAETKLESSELLRNGNFLKNKSNGDVYAIIYDESDCGNGLSLKLKKIDDIKGEDILVYVKDGRYARDSAKIYFVSWDTGQEPACSGNLNLKILPGADPKTFRPKIASKFNLLPGNTYEELYSSDSKTVFFGSNPVNGADPLTFRFTSDAPVTRDRNNVFLWGKKIPLADPDTYRVVGLLGSDTYQPIYGKDKNSVFVDYCLLEGADSATLQVISSANDAREGQFMDKQGIFEIEVNNNKTNYPDIVRAGACRIIRPYQFN